MSAYNPPCQAELTFMHVLPMRLKEMTEATLKLAAAMDRHSAALERQNEQQMTRSPELLERIGRYVRAAMEDRRG